MGPDENVEYPPNWDHSEHAMRGCNEFNEPMWLAAGCSTFIKGCHSGEEGYAEYDYDEGMARTPFFIMPFGHLCDGGMR